MSWRMHIAVVDTAKAQAIRVLPASHYENLKNDWPYVQKILCDFCKNKFAHEDFDETAISEIEELIKANGFSYDKKVLLERFREISNGPIEIEHEDVRDFTPFNHFVDEMGLIEDYTLGRFDDIKKDIGNPFFVDAETQKMFDYYNPRVIYKKDMANIIDLWRKLIVEQYKERLLDPTRELRWQGVLESKLDLWEAPFVDPYNLDDDNKCIVRAYDLEYRIFDLIRLYKAIDWMRDTVVFFGW